MSALAPILEAFFTDPLVQQRHANPHTIAASRDASRLLIRFAAADLTTTSIGSSLTVAAISASVGAVSSAWTSAKHLLDSADSRTRSVSMAARTARAEGRRRVRFVLPTQLRAEYDRFSRPGHLRTPPPAIAAAIPAPIARRASATGEPTDRT